MTVQRALWLANRLSLYLNFSFLNRIHYFSYQVATQLSSRGWVDPVPDPILPEKFLGYSWESNPESFGWQSDVLTTIPNRWSSGVIYCHKICLNVLVIRKTWRNHGQLARWCKWRSCDVGEAKEGLENELWCRWSNRRVVEWAVT